MKILSFKISPFSLLTASLWRFFISFSSDCPTSIIIYKYSSETLMDFFILPFWLPENEAKGISFKGFELIFVSLIKDH